MTRSILRVSDRVQFPPCPVRALRELCTAHATATFLPELAPRAAWSLLCKPSYSTAAPRARVGTLKAADLPMTSSLSVVGGSESWPNDGVEVGPAVEKAAVDAISVACTVDQLPSWRSAGSVQQCMTRRTHLSSNDARAGARARGSVVK